MSSNYFYIFFILISFAFLYIVTIYLQTLFAFKKDYAKYKCNPIMIPFSAAFGENPKDVFNECIEAEQTKTTNKFTSSLFSNLENSNKNMVDTNSMNAGTIQSQGNFKNQLLGNDNMKMDMGMGSGGGSSMGMGMGSSGLIPSLGESQKNISIQTTRMAIASKNVVDVLMANIKALILAVEGVPIVMEGVLNSPPLQMVLNIGALAGN